MVTDNHELRKPTRGSTDWDPDWYFNFDILDTLAELRGSASERHTYTPKTGAKFVATDTEDVYIGTGTGWRRLTSFGKNPQFESVESDDLQADSAGISTLETDTAFRLPRYDDVSNADGNRGSLIYATGVSDTAGVYRHTGTGWERLGSSGSGSGSGASALSELAIDTNKNWQGFAISGLGELEATNGTFSDIWTGSLTIDSAPTSPTDAVRLQDLGDQGTYADDPHGNEAHTDEFLTGADISTKADDPHGNEAHSSTFATTTQLDDRAESPHGNEAHSPNFAESSHTHNSGTLRPDAIETSTTTTNSLILGSASPINGYGDNIYVDAEGRLAASGGGDGGATGKSHVAFVDIDDFGADPTGQNYSDGAMDSAISALSDGDWLVLTQGNYRFREAHVIRNNYITVDGSGSLIRNEYDTYGGTDSTICFKGGLSGSSNGSPNTTNSSTIRPGDQVITVNNASDFSIGDDILIAEQTTSSGGSSTNYGWGGQSGRTTEQTRTIIRHISGNNLYITRGSSYFHGSGNAGIYRVDPCIKPRAINLHMRGGAAESFLTTYFTRNPEFRNIYVQNCTGFAYQSFYDYQPTWIDCVSKHPTYASDRSASQQEHMRLVGGTDHSLIRPVVEDARRAIDLNAGSHVVRIYNPTITNAQLHGICFHSQDYSSGDGNVRGAYEVFGGRIEAKQQRVTNDIYHSGLCASLSAAQTHVKLIGTTLVGRSAAVHTPSYANGQADNVTLIGCEMSSVPGYSGGDLIRQGGSNWKISDCTLRPNSGQNAIAASGSSSRESVQIMGNHIDGDVDLSGITVNGYWFKNNFWNGGGSSPNGSDHYINHNS